MRWISLVGLLTAVLVVGCSKDKPDPREVRPVDVRQPPPGDPAVADVVRPVASRPAVLGPVDEDRYEATLLEAVDFLAERKYPEALAALEKAKKYKNTDLVQREIEKVRTVLEQQAAADKAVQDVKAVLDDGKPTEAARLAGQALGQHGDGDRAEDLARLMQQADAVVSAGGEDPAARQAKLKSEAAQALANQNLRAGAIALEQALALGADEILARQLDDVRGKLKIYDANRALAADLRRDPTRLEEGLTCLQKASSAWDTLQVRQEIDEYRLIIEKRRDRLGVARFEVRGDVGAAAAGRTVAEELAGYFRPRFDVVERGQLNRVLDELRLDAGDLASGAAGGRELGRLAKVRYLVVGSITPLAGVTVQARLVEVDSGLIVQTARFSAPTLEALLPRLKHVAMMLQMTDADKMAFEARLASAVEVVRLVDAAPLTTMPPPPPIQETLVSAPPLIVTYTPRPAPLGGLVIQDFAALPPVVAVNPPPPAIEVVVQRDDPRRNRLLRLSLELGDNLFRRGRCREAQRHYSLALTLAGPQREIALRLDRCRDAAPPPPPPQVVVAPPVPASPLVVVQPVVVRPRLAVFGFLLNSPPGLVPPATGDWAADHFASYCGEYELIDRGEVCWYMGRLGVTLRDVLRDPAARICLAQALNARYFVFGAIQQTASFNVTTHLIDADSGAARGTAMIHVQDTQELKLRMNELVRQVGANPTEQKKLQEQGADREKALREARQLLKANEPGKAVEVTRAALKADPNNVALQTLQAEALRKQRLAAFEAAQRREADDRKRAVQAAKKRQEEWARESALARQKADVGREAAVRQQQSAREKAAGQLRKQASEASARGDNERAMRLLQSASALKPEEATTRQLAEARAAADRAAHERAQAEHVRREQALLAQRASALKRVQQEQEARARIEGERRREREAHDLAQQAALVKQAREMLGKKNYAGALTAAQSARRVKASAESDQLIRQAQDGLALADAEKKGAEARRALEEEHKKRETADREAKQKQDAYLTSLKLGHDAVLAKRYNEAVTHYQEAAKLFRTDAALNGLKTAQDLQKHERAVAEAGKKEKEKAVQQDREAKARRTAFEKELNEGKAKLKAGKKQEARGNFLAALKLVPTDAEAKALLAKAEEVAPARPAVAPVKPAVDPAAKKRQENFNLAMDAARSALKAKNYAGAVNAYNAALHEIPGEKLALAERSSAQHLLDADASMKRDAAYAGWMKQGQTALAQKKYADAVKAYDEALKIKPGDAAGIQGKQAAGAAMKQPAPATPPPVAPKPVAPPVAPKPVPPPQVAPKPVASAPVNPQAEYEKSVQQGAALEAQRKYAEAATAYQQAIKWLLTDGKKTPAENGQFFKAYMGLGRSEQATKRYAEAAKAYEEALKRMPNQPEAKAALQRARAGKP